MNYGAIFLESVMFKTANSESISISFITIDYDQLLKTFLSILLKGQKARLLLTITKLTHIFRSSKVKT